MKFKALILILAAGAALAGCESTKKAIGLGKNPPDEFQVVAQPPLSMPPDFNLSAPSPGAPRPQEASPQLAAENAMLANSASGTAPVDSCSWWIACAPGTQRVCRPASASRRQKSTSSE